MKPTKRLSTLSALLTASLVVMSFAATALASAPPVPGGSTFRKECEADSGGTTVFNCVAKKCQDLHTDKETGVIDYNKYRECLRNAGYPA